MKDQQSDSLPTESNQPPRRPYVRPELMVYGTIRNLTQQGGPGRNADGGNNARGNRT